MLFQVVGPDQVVGYWRGPHGELCEVDLSLEKAARIQRGETTVLGRNAVRRFTLEDLTRQEAATIARLDRVRAEMTGIRDRVWLHAHGIDTLEDPPLQA